LMDPGVGELYWKEKLNTLWCNPLAKKGLCRKKDASVNERLGRGVRRIGEEADPSLRIDERMLPN